MFFCFEVLVSVLYIPTVLMLSEQGGCHCWNLILSLLWLFFTLVNSITDLSIHFTSWKPPIWGKAVRSLTMAWFLLLKTGFFSPISPIEFVLCGNFAVSSSAVLAKLAQRRLYHAWGVVIHSLWCIILPLDHLKSNKNRHPILPLQFGNTLVARFSVTNSDSNQIWVQSTHLLLCYGVEYWPAKYFKISLSLHPCKHF